MDAQTPSHSRLTIFYVILAVATAVVAAVVISAGKDEKAQPSIAGGYDADSPAACLGTPPAPAKGPALPSTAPATAPVNGPSFDVKQSGQFVNISNFQGTLSGKLRLAEKANADGTRRLSGDVSCVNGKTAKLEGKAIAGSKPVITGTLAGQPISATLRRDPPDAGTPDPRAPGSIASLYKVSPRSVCLGSNFELTGSGSKYGLEAKSKDLGQLGYDKKKGAVTGDIACLRGGKVRVKALAVDRNLNNLTLTPLDEAAPAPGAKPAANGKPVLTTPSGLGPGGERVTATRARESFGATVAVFLLAIAIVMLFARLVGALAVKIAQPRVMGEVVAGIALGPTIFGWLLPGAQATLFPTDILPAFGMVANLGLIFYLFLVGLELDPRQLKGRIGQAAAISNTSVALPMILGLAVALPLYTLVGPDKKFVAFALFMGVAMSITAFPVLARILVERRMLKRPVGALTLACAAIDDVTAWFLIALATAVAVAGSSSDVIQTIALAIAFCLVMGFGVRPLVARVSDAYDEAGRVPGGWVVAIFAGVLLSAYVTETIGIAVIFGAFIMGMIMPRNAGLTEDVTRRIEDFVVTLLLPMFFTYTGLRTDIGLLDRPELWLITGVLIVVAIVGKLVGAMIAARLTGFDWRAATVIGTLMNTRGLTELIVLNLALEKGVISNALFASLVIMALVTTFMAGPMLKLLDPKNEYGAPIEEELEEARELSLAAMPAISEPERSILVASQTGPALEKLRALAEPLAASPPSRELVLVRVVEPPRSAGVRSGLQTEERLLGEAQEELTATRSELGEKGIFSRVLAFSSAQIGEDLAALAADEAMDLVMVDGTRPLLGDGIPRGDVRVVLDKAAADVAVLVAREDQEVLPGPGRPVAVPFGGQEHDWAALELAAWIASATGAEVRMVGAAGQTEEETKVQRVLNDAGLLVRQYSGVAPMSVVASEGREGLMESLSGSGLLVVGLSDRWQSEGLGSTRAAIARSGVAPILFVRRGSRPGALAPQSDVTSFKWSSVLPGGADPSLVS